MRGLAAARFGQYGHFDLGRGMAPQGLAAFPLFRRQAADQGQIFLVHLAPGKSRAQRQARAFGQGHQQKAAGILVQTVDNAGAQAFQSAQLWKASQQALHQGVFRAGRAGVHGESGGLVADHQAFVLPEQFKMAFLGAERVFRRRQLQQHSLTRTGFGVRPGQGQAVHQAAPGKHGLLQGRARKSGSGVPQDAIQASPGRVRRDQQLNTVHGVIPPGWTGCAAGRQRSWAGIDFSAPRRA